MAEWRTFTGSVSGSLRRILQFHWGGLGSKPQERLSSGPKRAGMTGEDGYTVDEGKPGPRALN